MWTCASESYMINSSLSDITDMHADIWIYIKITVLDSDSLFCSFFLRHFLIKWSF